MWSVLVLLLLLVPLLEIFVIIQVGQVIGAGWTIVLLIAESAVGAWIVKREGQRAWHALRAAFATGNMPTREMADAALILVGGTLLLTPGFVTDIVGFIIVLPFTRPLTRRLLSWMVARHVDRRTQRMFGGQTGGRDGGSVVRGEVVDDD